MPFALKAVVDRLATPANLKRWGLRKTERCSQCGNYGNLGHILNSCNISLNQGRFKWRHDSILYHLQKTLKEHHKDNNLKVLVDLPEMDENGATVPVYICPTSLRPDLTIIDEDKKRITLVELTSPLEENADVAMERKKNR